MGYTRCFFLGGGGRNDFIKQPLNRRRLSAEVRKTLALEAHHSKGKNIILHRCLLQGTVNKRKNPFQSLLGNISTEQTQTENYK